jgi:hypothetical protein
MVAFIALVVGYVMGAKAGSRDLDQLAGSLKRLAESEEFADVVSAARSHLGHTLRELGALVDGPGELTDATDTGDLVDRVRHLFAREG